MIYLDHNASTPVLPELLEKAFPYFSEIFANPSSKTHVAGKLAESAVDRARRQVAGFLGADPSEIIFTSGATESINIAIRGAFYAYGRLKNHIITVATEHKAVLETIESLKENGAEVTILPVDKQGRVNPLELENAIRPETLLAAIMPANNETGTIHPWKEISEILKERKVLFFCDASQVPFKAGIDLKEMGAAMLCISGHKMYSMKGAGALFISRRNPRLNLSPVIRGGGQEHGLRPGTLNVPAIVCLGEACELAGETQGESAGNLSILRKPLLDVLMNSDKVTIHTPVDFALANTISFSVKGFTASEMFSQFPDLCFSAGSACTSGLNKFSHVLEAMEVGKDSLGGAVRISFGLSSTSAEAQIVANSFLNFLR